MSDAAPPPPLALTGFAWVTTQPLGPLWWPAWAKAVTVCACILDGWRPWEGCTDCYNLGLEYDWDPSPPLDPNP